MYQAKFRAKARHVCARIEATPTAAEKPPQPCLRTRRYCIDGMSSNRLSLKIILSVLFEMGLHRLFSVSSAVPELGEHGVQPFRDFQPRDAWPLPLSRNVISKPRFMPTSGVTRDTRLRNRSPSRIEPVSGMSKRKLENDEQRLASPSLRSTSAGLAASPRLLAGSRRFVHSSLLREGVAVSGAADFMPTSRVTATLDTQLRKPVSVTYRTGLRISIADFLINTICLHEQFDTDLLSVWVPHIQVAD
jgi:hypothetical protein